MTLSKLSPEERTKRQKEILDMVAGEVQLRSKKLLIQTFIDENLPNIKPIDNVITAFEPYMDSSPIASQVLQKLIFSTETTIAANYSASWERCLASGA